MTAEEKKRKIMYENFNNAVGSAPLYKACHLDDRNNFQ